MTDQDRKALLDRMVRATREAKTLPPAEALRRLVEGGFYTEEGKLTPQYGGKATARG